MSKVSQKAWDQRRGAVIFIYKYHSWIVNGDIMKRRTINRYFLGINNDTYISYKDNIGLWQGLTKKLYMLAIEEEGGSEIVYRTSNFFDEQDLDKLKHLRELQSDIFEVPINEIEIYKKTVKTETSIEPINSLITQAAD